MDIEREKQRVRERIWRLLEEEGVATFPLPARGRIPNFEGSERAAEVLASLPEFERARCVFCAPDRVLKRVRELVLERGKVLAAALPHMTGFVELRERERVREATTIRGLRRFGRPLRTPVDLFVQGCVAVDRKGNRLGKGTGYGDREWRWLDERGLLAEGCKAVVLAHPLQIVEDLSVLMEPHDVRVDIIVTPQGAIRVEGNRGMV